MDNKVCVSVNNNLDLTVTGAIRIAIQEYLKQSKGKKVDD